MNAQQQLIQALSTSKISFSREGSKVNIKAMRPAAVSDDVSNVEFLFDVSGDILLQVSMI